MRTCAGVMWIYNYALPLQVYFPRDQIERH